MRPPPSEPISFDSLDYYVDPNAAQTLQFAALHALSVQLQAGEFLPPTQLLPSVSHVLLQTEEKRGGKYLENIGAALASQMRGVFLPVDAMLLASLLAEALGRYPEEYMDMLRGNGGNGNGGGGLTGSRRSGKNSRAESRARLAWEALAEALTARQAPVVVFIRSSDSLLCSTWENYSAFVSVFGAKSGEALTMEHDSATAAAAQHLQGFTGPAPIVLIAGAIISETGAALVGSKRGGGQQSSGSGDMSSNEGGAGIASRPDDSIRNLMAEEEDAAALNNAGQEDLGLAGLLLSLSRLTEEPRPNPRKLLARAFPTRVKLAPPPSGPVAAKHRARLQRDVEEEAQVDNHRRASAVAAATGVKVPSKGCEVYGAAVGPGGTALRREDWEKVLAWAVSIATVQKKKEEVHQQETAEASSRAQQQQQQIDASLDPKSSVAQKDESKEVMGAKSGGLRQRWGGGDYFSSSNNNNASIRRVSSAVDNSQDFYTEDITRESLNAPLLRSPSSSPEKAKSPSKTQNSFEMQDSDTSPAVTLPLRLEGVLERLPGGWLVLRTLSALKSSWDGLQQPSQNAAPAELNKTSSGKDASPFLNKDDLASDLSAFEPLQLSEASLRYGLAMLQRSGGTPRGSIQPENSYEKQLLGEVLAPEDLGPGFSSVGALQDAKRVLREAVQLPLQRPDLFETGALARHSTGVLLFGPPGTGKTLLARATAAESGASFLELSLSSLSSKWYGDSTKLVRAAFTLAAKLAPCVLFVDEVDALLGRRSSGGREHEATRELKNEFMARWDSIRGDSAGQVMVLGATNRPFDLDEAVLRRFSTRVAVPLPEKKARKQILEVVLDGQALDKDVSLEHVAERSDGFSGADLRQLCVAAAMRPIRDLIEHDGEKKRSFSQTQASMSSNTLERGEEGNRDEKPSNEEEKKNISELGATAGTLLLASKVDIVSLGPLASPQMAAALANATSLAQRTNAAGCAAPRPVTAADFEAARKEVGPTVDPDSSTIQELKEWDGKYGSMGARGEVTGRRLLYYT